MLNKFVPLILCLGLLSTPLVASEEAEEVKEVEGFVIIEKDDNPKAEMTYAEKAKALANDIKQGFIETSKVPGITSCIASGTQTYAGFRSKGDQEKAESITEFYLLMGEKEQPQLNLTSMNDVAAFLQKKVDERVGQNVEKGASWLGVNVVQWAAKCIKVGGEAYYRLRLNQAIVWAFEKQVKDIGQTGLKEEELLKEEK